MGNTQQRGVGATESKQIVTFSPPSSGQLRHFSAIRSLRHPNICHVKDVISSTSSVISFSTALTVPLDNLLHKLERDEILRMLLQISRAIQFIHNSASIIHGNLCEAAIHYEPDTVNWILTSFENSCELKGEVGRRKDIVDFLKLVNKVAPEVRATSLEQFLSSGVFDEGNGNPYVLTCDFLQNFATIDGSQKRRFFNNKLLQQFLRKIPQKLLAESVLKLFFTAPVLSDNRSEEFVKLFLDGNDGLFSPVTYEKKVIPFAIHEEVMVPYLGRICAHCKSGVRRALRGNVIQKMEKAEGMETCLKVIAPLLGDAERVDVQNVMRILLRVITSHPRGSIRTSALRSALLISLNHLESVGQMREQVMNALSRQLFEVRSSRDTYSVLQEIVPENVPSSSFSVVFEDILPLVVKLCVCKNSNIRTLCKHIVRTWIDATEGKSEPRKSLQSDVEEMASVESSGGGEWGGWMDDAPEDNVEKEVVAVKKEKQRKEKDIVEKRTTNDVSVPSGRRESFSSDGPEPIVSAPEVDFFADVGIEVSIESAKTKSSTISPKVKLFEVPDVDATDENDGWSDDGWETMGVDDSNIEE